ncbi:hypothetical protein PV733_09420 [Streptomyces europaeiscabiei]|uniref:hypothetical protein n=1 Tax=Streptomyces europaeiscabiei TaxID=146819 RepID=UPI0029B11F24|nr:hypothetical protein [Streptomyces europaeiscabiei]MDX3709182.1 hypothetical protein [Streptomyces europaeiscabiei]
MGDAPQPPAAPTAPAPPGPLSSFARFVRFVLFGGGVGLLSSGAVALLAGPMPWRLANAVIAIASTLLGTELHARFTFAAPHRPGRREHWQSAGSAAAYAATTAATLVLHLLQPSPGALAEQAVYLTASALAGVILAQMTTDFGGYALPSENGFKVVMAIGAGAALLAFFLASFVPKHRPAVRAPEGPAGEGPAGERAEVAGAAKA